MSCWVMSGGAPLSLTDVAQSLGAGLSQVLLVTAAVTALLLTPLAQGATALLIAATAIGFGNGIGSGLIMTLGADHAPPAARAHFLGIWRLMSDIGAACGPGLLSLLTAGSSLGLGVIAVGLLVPVVAAWERRFPIQRAGWRLSALDNIHE